MCSSKSGRGYYSSTNNMDQVRQSAGVAKINGRPVLQPTCNRVQSNLERRNSLKKPIQKPFANNLACSAPSPRKSSATAGTFAGAKTTARSLPSPPISPTNKSSRGHRPIDDDGNGSKRGNVEIKISINGTTKSPVKPATTLVKKPKKASSSSPPPLHGANTATNGCSAIRLTLTNNPSSSPSSLVATGGPPGSIAAARREEVANMQVLRKMRIAHYGRKKKAIDYNEHDGAVVLNDLVGAPNDSNAEREGKKCYSMTPNSDPIYVAYHDEEWGVPVQDDKLLFELLVLTAAQVGSDWATILKKRQHLRDAFSGFDAEIVAGFGEKKITSISVERGLEVSQVRGAVDNASRILKIKDEFGSFSNYLWRYVNYKPIATSYKSCQKIPVKTSKSEAISKDLVKRGLRYVGAAAVHSLMQAAGLTNDHLLSCSRRCQLLNQPIS